MFTNLYFTGSIENKLEKPINGNVTTCPPYGYSDLKPGNTKTLTGLAECGISEVTAITSDGLETCDAYISIIHDTLYLHFQVVPNTNSSGCKVLPKNP